jgi:hypothetical protein
MASMNSDVHVLAPNQYLRLIDDEELAARCPYEGNNVVSSGSRALSEIRQRLIFSSQKLTSDRRRKVPQSPSHRIWGCRSLQLVRLAMNLGPNKEIEQVRGCSILLKTANTNSGNTPDI